MKKRKKLKRNNEIKRKTKTEETIMKNKYIDILISFLQKQIEDYKKEIEDYKKREDKLIELLKERITKEKTQEKLLKEKTQKLKNDEEKTESKKSEKEIVDKKTYEELKKQNDEMLDVAKRILSISEKFQKGLSSLGLLEGEQSEREETKKSKKGDKGDAGDSGIPF